MASVIRPTASLSSRARGGVRARALVATTLLLSATVASCTETARIADVYTALDSNGNRKRNVFFTDSKEIHCVIEAGISRPGTTVEGIIHQVQLYDFVANGYFDTDRVAASVEVAPGASSGIQKIDIRLSTRSPTGSEEGTNPYPPGRFECKAFLDGHFERVAVFNVDFAPCPTATILPNSSCFGFYKDGTNCPEYGATSQDPARCRCNIKRQTWECDSR